nr:hypothetical protein GCM10017611_00270 [Rhodococcus wratislaviensis]
MVERVRCAVEEGSAALAADFTRLSADSCQWYVQGCDDCSGACFPPRLRCPRCGSAQLAWIPAGVAGTVVAVVPVVGHNARHRIPRALRSLGEYATAIVSLSEWPGVRFPALVVGPEALSCAVGDQVTLGRIDLGEQAVASATVVPPA